MRYFGISALVEQYLQEAGSKIVLELLKTGDKDICLFHLCGDACGVWQTEPRRPVDP